MGWKGNFQERNDEQWCRTKGIRVERNANYDEWRLQRCAFCSRFFTANSVKQVLPLTAREQKNRAAICFPKFSLIGQMSLLTEAVESQFVKFIKDLFTNKGTSVEVAMFTSAGKRRSFAYGLCISKRRKTDSLNILFSVYRCSVLIIVRSDCQSLIYLNTFDFCC